MRITDITLATTIEYNEQLHRIDLIGVIDQIRVPAFPFTVRTLGTSFCTELDGGEPEDGEASFTITYAFNGVELMRNQQSIKWAPGTRVARQNHRFGGLLTFSEPGIFAVEVECNYSGLRHPCVLKKSRDISVYQDSKDFGFKWHSDPNP